ALLGAVRRVRHAGLLPAGLHPLHRPHYPAARPARAGLVATAPRVRPVRAGCPPAGCRRADRDHHAGCDQPPEPPGGVASASLAGIGRPASPAGADSGDPAATRSPSTPPSSFVNVLLASRRT